MFNKNWILPAIVGFMIMCTAIVIAIIIAWRLFVR
jgi:hypothetical protein